MPSVLFMDSSAGIANDRIAFLTPGTSDDEVTRRFYTDTEQPGMGKAMGVAVGAQSSGRRGHAWCGRRKLLVPGVGPVSQQGLSACILGIGRSNSAAAGGTGKGTSRGHFA